jgi:hypothetical protein
MKLNKANIAPALVLILLLPLSAISQSLQRFPFEQDLFFNSCFDAGENINSYYVGCKPAFIEWDNVDERLHIKSRIKNEEGNYKKFIAPKEKGVYQLNFSGKKKISENQVFKGYFAFQKDRRNGWDWIATKNYDSGHPFIFGDSTSGSTRYNGILMNAQYGARLWKELLIGFSLGYYVDEGLKEVSPRPTSEHRDIRFNFGLGYELNEENHVGISFKTFDYNEKILYREDKGALYDETILFKFRGFDNPLIYNKKSETRNSYHNGYAANLTYQTIFENLRLAVSGGGGFENISLQDGGTRPVKSGYWKNSFYFARAKLLYKITGRLTSIFGYDFRTEDMWARHPQYDVLLQEKLRSKHNADLGFGYSLTDYLGIGLETGVQFGGSEMSDYYSLLEQNFDQLRWGAKIGIDYKWNKSLTTQLGYGYSKSDYSNEELKAQQKSKYYSSFRSEDLLYLITPDKTHSVFLDICYSSDFLGIFDVVVSYSNVTPSDNSVFSGFHRNEIDVFIEYKTQVY